MHVVSSKPATCSTVRTKSGGRQTQEQDLTAGLPSNAGDSRTETCGTATKPYGLQRWLLWMLGNIGAGLPKNGCTFQGAARFGLPDRSAQSCEALQNRERWSDLKAEGTIRNGGTSIKSCRYRSLACMQQHAIRIPCLIGDAWIGVSALRHCG